jgi:hypothetical protein
MVCATGRKPETTAARPSIAGGFVLVSVASLIAAWRACRSAPLGIGEFRAWLACREIQARRCLAEEGRAPAYAFEELARLLGVAQKRARASVNRLVDAGLLHWSEHAIGFPEPPTDFDPGLDDTIGQGRGSLAIPRRMLRHLVGGARPALIATVLGILLRCLSRRRDGFGGRGRVKSAWIARTFGVDLRRVKQARRELIGLGWIDPEPSGQRTENRWGRAFRIDLAWDRPAPAGGRSLPPLPPPDRPEIATPSVDREPFQERAKYQEPASGGPAGASLSESGGETETSVVPTPPTAPRSVVPPSEPAPVITPSAAPASLARTPVPSPVPTTTPTGPVTGLPGISPGPRPASPPTPSPAVPGPGGLPAPRLEDVLVEDLKDIARLLELLGQGVALGWVGSSEADRLRFVGAAEHALAIGKGNPAGLFIHLVRGKLWRYLTQDDENRANGRIKAFLRGPEPPRVASSSIHQPARPVLSEDARTVIRVRSALAAAGYRGDPFPQVRRHDPSWTRERWDLALAELIGA